jgi:uncharacterized protein with von Willebrand factor type A (vWA) domain
MSINYDVLLLPVFQEMRRLGADVSLTEYLQAIQTLRSGIGLDDAALLTQFCRLLWAKSREEQEMFDTAFAEKAAPKLAIPHEKTNPIHDAAYFAEDEQETLETADPVHDSLSPEEEIQEFAQPETDIQKQDVLVESAYSYTASLPISFPKIALPMPSKREYHFTPRLPLSKSDMIGHWRQLRRMQRTGPARELDIEATIHDICHYGLLRRPFMRPRAGNTAQVLLLIDQDGSMTPFKMLVEALIESLTRTSLAGKTALYCFHDCPGHTLYEDSLQGKPITLEQVLARYGHNNRVLIVSDAGAARAHYDDERIRNTRRFLETLHRYTYLYAWINPVPFSRWRFTTAEDIEQLVPMFPLDRDGLDDAIQILRGHPFPPGVSLHG